MRIFFVFVTLLLVACGPSGPPAVAPESGPLATSGLKLVMGVERTKTFVVRDDGTVVSESGQPILTFAGNELKLADGSKTILTLDGTNLNGPDGHVGTVDGGVLTFGDMRLWIKDDGVVRVEREGSEHTMRMHFDGPVAGRRRAALMLVTFFFALNIVAHKGATFEQFVD
jgi:hypothetical protein